MRTAATGLAVAFTVALATVLLYWAYQDVPGIEVNIVILSAFGAVVTVLALWGIGYLIWWVAVGRKLRDEEDPDDWTGPLKTGSGSAERRMRRFHVQHGLILFSRASAATRKRVAALDATGPLPRFPRRRVRRAILALRQAGRDVAAKFMPSRKVKAETPLRIRGGRHAMGQPVPPRPAEPLEPLPPDTGPAVTVALVPTRVTTSPLAPFFPSPSPVRPEVTVEQLGAPSVPEGDDVTDLLPIGQFDEPEPPEEPPAPVSEAPRPRPQDRPFTDWLRDSVVMEAIKDGAPS